MSHVSTSALVRARLLRGAFTAVLAAVLVVGLSPIAPTATAEAVDASATSAQKPSAQKTSAQKTVAQKTRAQKAGKQARKNKTHEGRPVEQMTLDPLPSTGARVMRAVRAQAGDPYVWGGAGPNRFDCSGLTQYVYRVAARKALPHSSSAQVGRTKRISRAAARPGDLVFFHNGGGVYHVAIYAGANSVWHAPGSGQRVTRAKIWTGSVFFGRVR